MCRRLDLLFHSVLPLFACALFIVPSLAARSEFGGYYSIRTAVTHDDVDGYDFLIDPQCLLRSRFTAGHGTFRFDADLGWRPTGVGRIDGGADLTRAYYELPGRAFDLKIGLQAVHWGSAHYWNPTNVFKETFLNYQWDIRSGQYAVRLDKDLGWRTALTVLCGFKDTGDIIDERVWALRLGVLSGITDCALVLGYDEKLDTRAYGLDFRGDIKQVGWVFEGARKQNQLGDWWEEIVIGFDHTVLLPRKLTFGFQYYYDGSGLSDRQKYDLDAIIRGENLSQSSHYLSFAASYRFPRRRSLSLSLLHNLDDNSIRLAPSYNWSRFGSFQYSIGAIIGLGSPGEYNTSEKIDNDGGVPEQTLYFYFKRSF